MIARRSFLTGLTASLFAAPAVVRAASLMPLRGEPLLNMRNLVQYSGATDPLRLDVLYGTMGARIGDIIRIRLPRDFSPFDIASPVEEYEYVLVTQQRSAAPQLMAHQ